MAKTSDIIQALIFTGICAFALVFSLGSHVEKRILIATDDHAIDYPTTQGLVKMKELIEQRTGGRLTVVIRPGAQLGGEKETIELTQMGIVDINRVNCSPMSEFQPEMSVLSLPYLFRNREHQWKVLDGEIGANMREGLTGRRLVGLAYYDSGARSFYNKKRPIYKPDDLKGLKIRVQKNEVMIDFVKALGASPDPISFEEVYSAIQTGRIDGAENNAPSYLTTSHFEVSKFYSLDEHSRVPEIVLFSKKTWDALPEKDRGIIAASALESEEHQKKLWQKFEGEALAAVKKGGSKINDMTVEQKLAFREKMKPVYDKYGAKHGALIEKIKEVQ